MTLTAEEQAIVDVAGDVKVIAMAGSGKTTSLIAKAKAVKDPSIALCFGKRNKAEIERMSEAWGVASTLTTETIHSLAMKEVTRGKKVKVFNDIPPEEIIAFLTLGNEYAGQHKPFVVANYIKQILSFFCNSCYRQIDEIPFHSFAGISNQEFLFQEYEKLLDFTDKVYEGIYAGKLPLTHDAYLKMFSEIPGLSLPYKYIFFDEIQDASPVMVEIMMRQKATKVFLGDEHQQIYSFRYAIDTIQNLEMPELTLSSSFRFGEEIADAANFILFQKAALGIECRIKEVIGAYAQDTQKRNGYAAVIARTNMGLLRSTVKLIASGDPIASALYFEGDLRSYQVSDGGIHVTDVLNLFNGDRSDIGNPVLRSMRNFDQLKTYANDVADHSLLMLMELVETYKSELPKLLREFKRRSVNTEDKEKATLILTTAHKSKGLEYDEIILDSDFPAISDVMKMYDSPETRQRAIETLNLIYVAITRSKGVALIPFYLTDRVA